MKLFFFFFTDWQSSGASKLKMIRPAVSRLLRYTPDAAFTSRSCWMPGCRQAGLRLHRLSRRLRFQLPIIEYVSIFLRWRRASIISR
jgi:hypothetical protein